jgi:hypothetical protein
METSKYMWIAIGLVGITFAVAAGMSDIQNSKSRTEIYIKCVDAMIEAIPDPNDDGRASFLKECQK